MKKDSFFEAYAKADETAIALGRLFGLALQLITCPHCIDKCDSIQEFSLYAQMRLREFAGTDKVMESCYEALRDLVDRQNAFDHFNGPRQ